MGKKEKDPMVTVYVGGKKTSMKKSEFKKKFPVKDGNKSTTKS